MTPTPDPALAARLLELSVKSTQDPLNEDGRYFNGDWHEDLTQCSHGDTGNYSNKRDGQFIAALWNAYRSGQLITLADHEAAVAKAVEAALREHTGREETGESITEKYLRRYPRSKKTRAWEGAMVNLRTQNGIWRPDGHGYTLHFSEAWVLPLADARKIVSGIYEDHGGTYYHASAAIRAAKEMHCE